MLLRKGFLFSVFEIKGSMVLFVVVSVVFTLRLLRNLRVHARMKSEISRQKLLSDWFETKE